MLKQSSFLFSLMSLLTSTELNSAQLDLQTNPILLDLVAISSRDIVFAKAPFNLSEVAEDFIVKNKIVSDLEAKFSYYPTLNFDVIYESKSESESKPKYTKKVKTHKPKKVEGEVFEPLIPISLQSMELKPPVVQESPISIDAQFGKEAEKQNENGEPEKIEFVVNKFIAEGELPIDEDEISEYFEPLQGKSYDLKALQTVAQDLEKFIRDEGFPFYRVALPSQPISEGEVKFNVVAYELENINVEGADIFSKESISNSLPELKKGLSPNTQDLVNSLTVSNKQPGRQVQLTFKQHEREEKVDADLKVTELPRPFQFALMFNNNGTDSSGEYRLTGAAQYNNLWGLDHVVNASYTLPPDHADTIKQYGGSYALPIYAMRGWLNMYFASSNTNNGTVATDLAITGAGEMMGIHYQQFLPKIERYEHNLDIGLDSKHFINDVQFKTVQIGNNVRSLPFSVSYKGEYPFRDVKTGYFLQLAMNTGLGTDNTDTDYRRSRLGSESSWHLFRYGTNFITSYEKWSLKGTFTGQYAAKPLISGEQLGIGGSYDVRGYEQRETGADNGEIMKVELTTPTWEKINAFAFYDYGRGSKEKTLVGEIKDWNLSATGIGAKLTWQENFNASLTLATALNDAATTKAFNNRLLLNVSMRY